MPTKMIARVISRRARRARPKIAMGTDVTWYNAAMRRRIRCKPASWMISQRAIKRIAKLWDLSFDAAARLHCETTTSR